MGTERCIYRPENSSGNPFRKLEFAVPMVSDGSFFSSLCGVPNTKGILPMPDILTFFLTASKDAGIHPVEDMV